ncbi:MAG: PAS domain S-box protein [Thermoanaerobaculia bacterium]
MKVLIVDDDPTNRKLLRVMLRAEGHETAEAADGLEALEALKHDKFAVVITDILMPRMDGYRLCHEIRQREDLDPIAIVIYSSTYTSPADERVAIDVGADRFVRKPAAPQELLGILQGVHRSPRRAAGGRSLGDLETMREYSEALVRKLEEKNADLERSEGDLRELVDLSPVGIYTASPEGRFLSVNKAFAMMLGYDSETDLSALEIARDVYWDTSDRSAVLSRFEAGERGLELKWRRRDGTPTWVEIDGRAVKDSHGRTLHFEAFVRDINTRKRAEADADRSISHAAARRRRKVMLDLVALLIASVVVGIASTRYDPFNLVRLRPRAPTLTDETLTLVIGVSFLFGGFAYRRWLDLRKEVRSRETTEYSLRQLRMDLEQRVRARTAALEASNQDLRREMESRRAAEETAFKLDLAVEQSSNVVFMTDIEGRITYVNPAFTTVYGYSKNEVLGQNPRILKSGAVAPETYARFWAAMLSGAGFRGEVVNRARDGRLVTVESAANTVFDDRGERIGFVAVQTDVTERKRAEAELQKSQERFRSLIESSKDLILILDPSAAIRYASPSLERAIGYRPEEVIGKSAFPFVHPDDLPRVQNRLREILAQETPTVPFAFRVRHRNGSWPTLEAVGTNLIGNPAIGGVVLNARDVTEMRQLEEQFRHAQKMEAVGRLAGGIAHDFNNLLMVVQSFADVLPLHLGDTKALAHDLEQLRSTAERGGSLTRQLLAFSRKQVVKPEVLDAGRVTADLAAMLEKLIGEDVALEIRLDPETCRVRADRGQIEQVLMNLSVNARDAMPQGGQLLIEVQHVELDESYVASHTGVSPGAFVRISVSDTGTGMDAEVRRRLFEPFFTTKESGRGTGLGLATAYGIVKAAGGDIWVYSEPGKGSVFKIHLPRVDGAGASATPEAIPVLETRGTETIFLVEDEDVIREMVKEFLEMKGYLVHAAGSGDEAIRRAASLREPIDLLLTDIVLPGPNGRQVAEAMSRTRSAMKTLFMSGYIDDAQTVREILSEGRDYIQKPIGLEALARKVREILDR